MTSQIHLNQQAGHKRKCSLKPGTHFHWEDPEWVMLYAACWIVFLLKVLFVFFCFKHYFRMRRREREGREREEREHAERERPENQVEEVEEEQDYNEMD